MLNEKLMDARAELQYRGSGGYSGMGKRRERKMSDSTQSGLINARAELKCALNQMASTDDQIIADHIRAAYAILGEMMSQQRRGSDGRSHLLLS